MTERERLEELLMASPTDFDGNRNVGVIADYLIANGVIVSPCKVGDTVYDISRRGIIPIQIDTIQYTKRGIDICGSNEEYFGYSTIHLDVNNQIGMEWYKTKEEAEKALYGQKEAQN